MSSKQTTIAVLSLLILLVSCNKNESETNDQLRDCVFEQIDGTTDGIIDDNERMIMDDCMENSLSTKSSIESNLLGEWTLIGHGEGWLPTNSQPCGYLTI